MESQGFVMDSKNTNFNLTDGNNDKNKSEESIDSNKVISVIGSGDYGRAISGRLVKSGYTVFIGSRDPNRENVKTLVRQTGANLVNQDTAVSASNVIIVAVGRDHYDYLPLSSLQNKILIDVSNNPKQRKGPHLRSNAEYLQGLIPEAKVVKGFNVISAYSLENGGLQGSKEVFMASDSNASKTIVSAIIRSMGYTPIDWGTLRASRDIEDIPLRLMPSWRKPIAVSLCVFLIFHALAIMTIQICPNAETGNWKRTWKYLPLFTYNKSLGLAALTILSLCYLPGVLASYIQLYRGTKYSRFPNWLDNWLKMRKQLGLIMFGLACMHGCLSVAYINPQQMDWIYEPPTQIVTMVVTENGTRQDTVSINNLELTWHGELFLSLGAFAICLLAILAISSLPSVTATLTWREFAFIHSKLGWLTLIIASLHDIFFAWHLLFTKFSCFDYLPRPPQYVLYIPTICVVLKIILLLPPVDNYLQRIRKGYERSSRKYQDEKQEIA